MPHKMAGQRPLFFPVQPTHHHLAGGRVRVRLHAGAETARSIIASFCSPAGGCFTASLKPAWFPPGRDPAQNDLNKANALPHELLAGTHLGSQILQHRSDQRPLRCQTSSIRDSQTPSAVVSAILQNHQPLLHRPVQAAVLLPSAITYLLPQAQRLSGIGIFTPDRQRAIPRNNTDPGLCGLRHPTISLH